MALSLSFVLCSDDLGFSALAIRDFLASNWPDLPRASNFSEAGSTLAFDMGTAHVMLGRVTEAFPWNDLAGPCATSVVWPEAASVLKRHRAHIIVSLSTDRELIDRAKLLTQVTAATMAATPSAVGVFWGNATLVLPKALFIEFAVQILPLAPPLHIWLDVRVAPNADGSFSGFTTGMAALGHMEFETLNSTQNAAGLRERLFALANYVLENGPVISDGNTVGADAREKIRVVFADSKFGHHERVMRLIYEPVKPAKPFWKIW